MQSNDVVKPAMASSASNKRVMLIIALLGGSVSAFMTSSLNVALPSISQAFHADAILQNWVVTSFVLSMAVFSIPMGRFADIVGLKKIAVFGILIFLVSDIAAAFSSSAAMLIICRSVQGIGSAMISSTTIATVSIIYPAKERGKILGIYISSVYAWLSIGPFLGGLLTEYLGWQSLFWFAVPFSVAIFLLFALKLKGEWAGSQGEKFDYPGSLIFGAALVALIYGFSRLPGSLGIIFTVAGIAGILLFLVWENRAESPIINVRVFRHNRGFIFSNTASLINYSATSAIAYLISLYLQLVKGFSPFDASLILISQPIIQMIISPFTGRLSDRVQPQLVASAGMTLIFLGILGFVFLNESTPMALVIVILAFLGIGYGLFVPPNTNAVISSVEPKYYAVASSFTGTMRTVGQTLSMGITLVVTAIVIGPVVMTPQNHANFLPASQVSFIIFAVLCFAGIFASLARGKSNLGDGAPKH